MLFDKTGNTTDETVQWQHLINTLTFIYTENVARLVLFCCFILTTENLIWPVFFYFSVHGDRQRNICSGATEKATRSIAKFLSSRHIMPDWIFIVTKLTEKFKGKYSAKYLSWITRLKFFKLSFSEFISVQLQVADGLREVGLLLRYFSII